MTICQHRLDAVKVFKHGLEQPHPLDHGTLQALPLRTLEHQRDQIKSPGLAEVVGIGEAVQCQAVFDNAALDALRPGCAGGGAFRLKEVDDRPPMWTHVARSIEHFVETGKACTVGLQNHR